MSALSGGVDGWVVSGYWLVVGYWLVGEWVGDGRVLGDKGWVGDGRVLGGRGWVVNRW